MADPYAAAKPGPGDTEFDAAVKIVQWMLRNESAFEALRDLVNQHAAILAPLQQAVSTLRADVDALMQVPKPLFVVDSTELVDVDLVTSAELPPAGSRVATRLYLELE
jgi:hypothetical protein